MPIYLINKMAVPHLTSNNTKYCTYLMSPSDQLSSPVDSSLSHSHLQQLKTVSLFQLSWVYKQANLSQIIQYHHYSCLDDISSSPSLYLATACCPGRTIPSEEDFCSRRCFARRSRYCPQEPHQFDVASPTRSHHNFCCLCLLHRIFVEQLFALASLNCHLLPHLPVGTGRPCCTVVVTLCGTSPCSCELTLATWCRFNK